MCQQVYYKPNECSYERLLQEFFSKVCFNTKSALRKPTKHLMHSPQQNKKKDIPLWL